MRDLEPELLKAGLETLKVPLRHGPDLRFGFTERLAMVFAQQPGESGAQARALLWRRGDDYLFVAGCRRLLVLGERRGGSQRTKEERGRKRQTDGRNHGSGSRPT